MKDNSHSTQCKGQSWEKRMKGVLIDILRIMLAENWISSLVQAKNILHPRAISPASKNRFLTIIVSQLVNTQQLHDVKGKDKYILSTVHIKCQERKIMALLCKIRRKLLKQWTFVFVFELFCFSEEFHYVGQTCL